MDLEETGCEITHNVHFNRSSRLKFFTALSVWRNIDIVLRNDPVYRFPYLSLIMCIRILLHVKITVALLQYCCFADEHLTFGLAAVGPRSSGRIVVLNRLVATLTDR